VGAAAEEDAAAVDAADAGDEVAVKRRLPAVSSSRQLL
jgi:hypothetical protein